MRFLSFLSVFVLACSSIVTVQASEAPVEAPRGDAKAGQTKAATCAACHGADGNSVTPDQPSLAGQGERYLVKQIQDIKSGKRNVAVMTGFVAGLSDQDILDISAFYAAQTPAVTGATDAEKARIGEQIYRAGLASRGVPACSGCHAPTGEGLAAAGFPRLAGQHKKYIVTQLTNFREEMRTNDGDTRIMRGVAEGLSNRDIDAVAEFISGLKK
jgi:cytochrome c553